MCAAPCKLRQAKGTCDRFQISTLERLQHELEHKIVQVPDNLCIHMEMKQKHRLHSAGMGR